MGISSVYPTANQEYVPVTTKITVTFGNLVTHSLIDGGTFVVYAPGDTLLSGPLPHLKIDKLLDDEPNEYNIIRGSFEIFDYDDGYGVPYTYVEFTPTRPLHEFNPYVCLISYELTGGSTVYKWTFTTGEEGVTEVPEEGLPTGPVIVVGDTNLVAPIAGSSNLLQLTSSFPMQGAYDQETTTGTIVLVFNKDLDPTSIDVSKFTISGEVADGHKDKPSHGIVPITSVQVIGNKVYLHLEGETV